MAWIISKVPPSLRVCVTSRRENTYGKPGSEKCFLFLDTGAKSHLAEAASVGGMAPFSDLPLCLLTPALSSSYLPVWLAVFSVVAKTESSAGREPTSNHSSGRPCDLGPLGTHLVGLL